MRCKFYLMIILLVTSVLSYAVTSSKPQLNQAASQASKKNQARCLRVVIDPGHGGYDTGAISSSGLREKNVVLAISRDLYSLVKATPGYCAYMTRTNDSFVSLRGRLAIARKYGADIFIAIHADKFKDPGARGASVFAVSKRGATSEAARWLAQKENTSELLGGPEIDDASKPLKTVLLNLSQNATIGRSMDLGKTVLMQLNKVSHLHHVTVEQAGFIVLKSPDISSILVETGFLSNKQEEANLRQPAYQKKIANAIYRGILAYNARYPL